MGAAWAALVLGAIVCLATSWVLVTRLERVGERLGLSEALLGMLAALAADAPEITVSVTGLLQHHKAISAGVVIGSNVFNLAALLGLSAVVAGSMALHRRVVVLGGTVAVWVAVCSLAAATGAVPAAAALAGSLVVLAAYVVVLGVRRGALARLPVPARWSGWLRSAIDEEESELVVAIRPPRGRAVDAWVAAGALVVVVLASVAMERGATWLGAHFEIPDAVVGALGLAVVTSLPNAVAAVYLATRARAAASLSTALNSNNLNVVAGLLIPGVLLGLAPRSGPGTLAVVWYVALTVLALVLAYVGRGLRRGAGWTIILGYAGFVAVLLAIT